jgi:hypothetical protein
VNALIEVKIAFSSSAPTENIIKLRLLIVKLVCVSFYQEIWHMKFVTDGVKGSLIN